MAAITVLIDNTPHGPFTRAQIAEKLNRSEIGLESLAFVEGLSQWTPLRDVLAKVDAATPAAAPVISAPAATAPSAYAAPASAYTVAAPQSIPSSAIASDYSYAATMQPPTHLVYAGFWLRFIAHLIDIFMMFAILMGIFIVLGLVVAALASVAGNNDVFKVVIVIIYGLLYLGIIVGQWLYFAKMESGPSQATLGKRLMGLQVTDRQGNRVSFGRATGRFFAKIISGFTFFIGYMMAGWTERKQALHDMVADTLVVRRPGA